jgi:hypothetical protein
MLGIAIYHDLELRRNPAVLASLLSGLSEATGGQLLAYFGGMLAASGRFSRELQMTAKNLAQLGRELEAGAFETLEFHEQKVSVREQNVEGVSLHVNLAPDPYGGGDSVFPYVVTVLLPDAAPRGTGALVFAVEGMAQVLGSPYSFIYAGADFNDVFMELTATPIFPWNHVFTPEEKRKKERLTRVQLHRERIGERVRGAYWGNFLGPQLVALRNWSVSCPRYAFPWISANTKNTGTRTVRSPPPAGAAPGCRWWDLPRREHPS